MKEYTDSHIPTHLKCSIVLLFSSGVSESGRRKHT